MKTEFDYGFDRDLEKIERDERLKKSVKKIIETIERADSLAEVPHIKRLKGGSFFPIRIGDYRMGISLHGDTVTFWRFLHRKEIYRVFP